MPRIRSDRTGANEDGREAYSPRCRRLISFLPFPIAYPTDLVAAETTHDGRIFAAIIAYRVLTQFLALVALADYLRGEHRREETDKKIVGLLSKQMTDGDWRRLLEEILARYKARRDDFFLQSLVSLHFHKASGEFTEVARGFKKRVKERNVLAHALAAQTPQPKAELAAEWVRSLEQDVLALEVLSEYELLQPVSISTRYRAIRSARVLRGPSLNFRFREEMSTKLTVEDVEQLESMLLVDRRDRSRQLLLSPLVLSRTAEGQVFLLSQVEEEGGKVTDATYFKVTEADGKHKLSEHPDGDQILNDLRALLKPLGRVGMATTLRPRKYAAGGDAWARMRRYAQAWERVNHSYEVVLEFGREAELRETLEDPTIWTKSQSGKVEAFILVVALHYRLAWQFWAARNTKNEHAARRLLELLHVAHRFHRPRLRALCALQTFDRDLLRKVLTEGTWPQETVQFLERHVLPGRMIEYLRYLVGHASYPLPQRAEEVLSELEPTGAGGIDLPLGPEEDG
jgi:hypothetical protein